MSRPATSPYLISAQSCLYGLAVGDAFGARYEFMSAEEAQQVLENDKTRTHIPMRGGGKHKLRPGQITDDTEMALALAQSIVETGYIQETAAFHYVKWMQSNPIDCGIATQKALTIDMKSASTKGFSALVMENAMKYNGESLSNGPLMRIAPLAVYGLRRSVESYQSMVYADCALTHPNPTEKKAVFLYAMCLREALLGKGPNQVIETALNMSRNEPYLKAIVDASQDREEPFVLMKADNFYSMRADSSYMGCFSIALHCALYEVKNFTSFQSSMERIARKGGDTDTNCAIAGALLGALFLVIPKYWLDLVYEDMKDQDIKTFRDLCTLSLK